MQKKTITRSVAGTSTKTGKSSTVASRKLEQKKVY